jgi:hypothetical protein
VATNLSPREKLAIEALNRYALRGVCVFFAFFAIELAVLGVEITALILVDNIPAGVVQSISEGKHGYLLQFDSGREANIPYRALSQKRKRINLAVGDRVEKKPDSATYFINGRAVTDRRWLLREILMPTGLLVLLGIYLLLGGVYAVKYRRSPIGDLFRAEDTTIPPPSPIRVAGAFCALVCTWLALALPIAFFFGCFAASVVGLLRPLRR